MKKLACLLFALAALPVQAAVRLAGDAVESDATRVPRTMGEETLHPVRLDRAAIEASASSGRLLLPGAGTQPMTARFERMDRRDDGLLVWVGKVDTGYGPQSVVLTVGDDVAFGLIPQREGTPLRIETRQGKTWLVEGEARRPAFEHLGPDFLVPPATKAGREIRARQDATPKVVPEPVVEVVVVYTAKLVSVMGSDAAVQARIVQLEAISNQAYVDSLAEVRIKVLAKHLVDYPVNNDNDDALGQIQSPSSLPVKIEVDRLRAQYGADLVSLVRNFDRSTQNSCGIAYLLGYHGDAFAPNYGFSVVSDRGFGGDNCGEFTFVHELGHNMGASHDFDTEEGDYGAYPYSRGYRQTIGASGFGTVMAYTVDPQVRIGTFSNPRISTCQGQPCGLADSADNARGLGEAAPTMAGFVASIPNSSPTLSINDVTVTEGNAGTRNASFTVSLSAPAPGPVTFDLFTNHGTAIGADYVVRTQNGLSIPAGQSSLVFDVVVRGDVEVEFDEVFGLNARNVVGAKVLDGQGVATITNDEPIPNLSVADVSVGEGNAGTVRATFTATLSAASTTPVTFDVDSYNYAPGPNSATEGVDYTDMSANGLTIPAGATMVQFSVPVIGDTAVEQDEYFYVIGGNVTAANLTDGMASARIRNDDGGATPPNISIAPLSITEGNAGTSLANFSISLSASSATAVTFGAATSDGSATAGSDYVARIVPLQTIPAGQTSATFAVTINGDTTSEGNETFSVTLNNVVGALVTTGQAQGTITNDDNVVVDPVFAVRDDRWVANEASQLDLPVLGNDVFTASRLAGGTLTITTAPTSGTATVMGSGTAGTVADDTIAYTPAIDFSGESVFGYRLCESGGRCAEGIASVVLRPTMDRQLDSASSGALADLTITRERLNPAAATYGALYGATPLVAPDVQDRPLVVDATPETPWDAARAGTSFVLHTLPANATPRDWRVLVDASSLGNGNVDLYLGADTDNDGGPDANEVRCTAAMHAQVERCELALSHPGTGVVRYWVMVHNIGNGAHTARMEHYAVPMIAGDGTMVVTGPGQLSNQATVRATLAWSDLTLLQGARRIGYASVRMQAGKAAGVFPVLFTRTGNESEALAMSSGVTYPLQLAQGAAQERMYIDVPAGATNLTVNTTSAQNVDLYLARSASPSSPTIAVAPARGAAQASAVGATGNETLAVTGAQLTPGRWYVTPVNAGTGPASLSVRATITGTAPVVRPGSYFNSLRSGHGLFLYPAGSAWAGLWYTYLPDGSPTWYYLQGAAPGANGIWTGILYRSMWTGSTNQLTAIGQGIVTPTGADAFSFSYRLDGESGSEPLAALGRGCPSLGGSPLDVSSHWFNPATAGSGYSVQMFPSYEFYTAFVYDGAGVARYLLAERNGFGGATATMNLSLLTGFCPTCNRTGNPTRRTVGSFSRSFGGGSFTNITLDAIYGGGLPGGWNANHAVQPLGGPGTTQGCATP